MPEIAILPLKEMPVSCDKCNLCETTEEILGFYNVIHICSANGKIQVKERFEDANDDVIFNNKDFNFREERSPQCPLISIDIDELKSAVDTLYLDLDLSLVMGISNSNEENPVTAELQILKEQNKDKAVILLQSTISKLGGKHNGQI